MIANKTGDLSVLEALPKERYEIGRLLGTGGSGQVFAGRDLQNGDPVVLKLVRLPNAESRARIEREISLVKKLGHFPYIVHLIDARFSTDATSAVLIYKYIEGPTVQSLVELSQHRLADNVVAAIARQLCSGIAQLHRHGIVHRDIKPSNVLVAKDGSVMLIDFGIAVAAGKREDDESEITKVGDFVGTMRYAAPETLTDKHVSPVLDIYALGVTILFMLLGRQPFENAPLQLLLNQVLKGTFLQELPDSLRPLWGDILSAALNINPQERPSADALLAMLRAKFPPGMQNDREIVAAFLHASGSFRGPPPDPPVALSATPEPEDSSSLKGSVQSLAAQILQVQAAVADITTIVKKSELGGVAAEASTATAVAPESRIDATFMTVRRRLELNWRMSLIMTLVLFSLFVAMLILAVAFGLVYQKSYWGILFGGTSALSLLTVVVWRPMDKMLFSTIATQQLELIQLNYQRALNGSRQERREAFRDVSTQLNSLLAKISTK